MIDGTDSWLLSIGMNFVEQLIQGRANDATAVIQGSVLFFVNCFQFGMKQSKHGVDKTVGFNRRPLLQSV